MSNSKTKSKKSKRPKDENYTLIGVRIHNDLIDVIKKANSRYNTSKNTKITFADFMMCLLSMAPYNRYKDFDILSEKADLKVNSVTRMDKLERKTGYKDGVAYDFKSGLWKTYFHTRLNNSFSFKTYDEALEFYQKRLNLKNDIKNGKRDDIDNDEDKDESIENRELNRAMDEYILYEKDKKVINKIYNDSKDEIEQEKELMKKELKKSKELKYFDPYRFRNQNITVDDLEDFQKQMKEITQDGGEDTEGDGLKTGKDLDEILLEQGAGKEITDDIFNNVTISKDREYISKSGVNLKGVKLTQEEMGICGVGEISINKKIDCIAPKRVDKLKKNIKDMERVRSIDDNDWDGMEKFVGSDLNRMEETIKSYDPTKIKKNPMSKDPLYKYLK